MSGLEDDGQGELFPSETILSPREQWEAMFFLDHELTVCFTARLELPWVAFCGGIEVMLHNPEDTRIAYSQTRAGAIDLLARQMGFKTYDEFKLEKWKAKQ